MKANVYTKYGPPSVFKIIEMDKPTAKTGEVLIKVHAATVNRTDCGIMRATPFFIRGFTGILKPKRPIPGTDFAGEVVSVGKNVTRFKPGDKVFSFADMGLSSHAQYVIRPDDDTLNTMPDNVSWQQATACIEGAHYAYNFFQRIPLKPGNKVLVNGSTGAIGSAMVQLAVYFGAEVTATCRGKDFELVKSLGATRVIDYTREDFTQTDEKYDYVYDTCGKSSFGRCKPILVKGGTYFSCDLGPKAQNPFLDIITRFVGDKKMQLPTPTDIGKSLRLIKKLVEEGSFTAVIDKTYSLDNIADAYEYVEKGEKIGNVVINMLED